MAVPTHFTIDKVAWHVKTESNPETPEEVRRRFKTIVDFLQREGLTARELLKPDAVPSDDFAIKSSDLNSVGLAVMKAGYDKWLKKIVNQRKDVTDVSILESCLAKIRGGR